jgi:hypothetical protein
MIQRVNFLVLFVDAFRSSFTTRGTSFLPRSLSSVFTPGSYASIVLFGSYQGWNGYSYSMLPSYDDND